MSDDPGARSPEGFRLAKALKERLRQEGSYAALARAITRANGPRPDDEPADVIDRRKLKSLVEVRDKGAVLSIADLYALDRYLERYGEGLAHKPLLEKPVLMQALADSREVTFVIGSKPEEERASVSHWDVLAMAEVQRAIGQSSEVSVRFDIQTVPLHASLRESRKALERHEALELLEEGGPSLVCLGSSRSNPLSEMMAARIFDRPAFATAPRGESEPLPFGFVWNPGLPNLFPSHFNVPPEDIAAKHPQEAALVVGEQASALIAGDELLVDQVTPRRWGRTFGVCVAQHRRHKRVWLMLMGITGAATFVAAKAASRMATDPSKSHDAASLAWWGIVSASVPQAKREEFFDVRDFEDEQIVMQPPVPVPPPR